MGKGRGGKGFSQIFPRIVPMQFSVSFVWMDFTFYRKKAKGDIEVSMILRHLDSVRLFAEFYS